MGIWKIMNYAITGHTRGIGKFIFENTANCLGFSKSTGYDITRKVDRQRIISESKNVNIFINNANDEYGQTLMLHDLWNEWKDLNKTIINVGSNIAEPNCILGETHAHLLTYRNQKLALKNMYIDLVNIPTTLKLKYTWFGYVGTEAILKKYPQFTTNDYISVREAAELILND